MVIYEYPVLNIYYWKWFLQFVVHWLKWLLSIIYHYQNVYMKMHFILKALFFDKILSLSVDTFEVIVELVAWKPSELYQIHDLSYSFLLLTFNSFCERLIRHIWLLCHTHCNSTRLANSAKLVRIVLLQWFLSMHVTPRAVTGHVAPDMERFWIYLSRYSKIYFSKLNEGWLLKAAVHTGDVGPLPFLPFRV